MPLVQISGTAKLLADQCDSQCFMALNDSQNRLLLAGTGASKLLLVKNQIVNLSGFAGHTVSVGTTHLFH